MRLTAAMLLFFPTAVFAVGSDDSTAPPPKPVCLDGKVLDSQSGNCVAPKDARLDDGERYEALRQYAYIGDYPNAEDVLDAFNDPRSGNALTYRGFLARKTGNMQEAMRWYASALEANPDNLLARGYFGIGLVESGQLDLAKDQLLEIRQRGGKDTWAEAALVMAIKTGRGANY